MKQRINGINEWREIMNKSLFSNIQGLIDAGIPSDRAIDMALSETTAAKPVINHVLELIPCFNAMSLEWQRPSAFGYAGKPEPIRDLLAYGFIECRPVKGINKFNTVCEYRIKPCA